MGKLIICLLICINSLGQDYISYEKITSTPDSISQTHDTTVIKVKSEKGYKVLKVKGDKEYILGDFQMTKENEYGFSSTYYKCIDSDVSTMIEFFYKRGKLIQICTITSKLVHCFIIQPLNEYL